MRNVQSPRSRPLAVHLLAFSLLAGIIVAASSSKLHASSELPRSCVSSETEKDKLLGCVKELIESAPEREIQADTIISEPLQGYLGKLSDSLGYTGSNSDLDILKQLSLRLKESPLANRAAITVLDSAIASHADEMRAALSTRSLAAKAAPGTDIYAAFIDQKLTYLGSERAKFYDGGPFELARRYLLASAIESKYFIELARGHSNSQMLRSEMAVLDEILDRISNPIKYPHIPMSWRNSDKVSDRFWRASLLFAMDEKSELRNALRHLVIDNSQFGLNLNPGHIYIYRVFHFPQKIIVQKGVNKDGEPLVESEDMHLLNRHYNPAQLALLACSWMERAGYDDVFAFGAAIKDLVFSDYHVVVASANDSSRLQDLETAIRRLITTGELADEARKLSQTVSNLEVIGFSKAMKDGARLCGIEDQVRDNVFSPFDFQTSIQRTDVSPSRGAQRRAVNLVIGGRLNASQASAVADFFSKNVFSSPEIKALQAKNNITLGAFSTRMRIEQN